MIKEKDLNHVVFFILLHRNLIGAKLQAVPNAIMTQVHLENISKRFIDMSFMPVKGILTRQRSRNLFTFSSFIHLSFECS